ncbi:prolyl-tRNA editing enzyme YbaK/EbsC (Cys-tRNA(Pro) deacylase) [Murinocardiopsis flavida]|uniref:Prolyl-tRNA editing enzyme YbaK/EbsC (Cys-tRNA(Pro) deacylase) n=1 Tax=Murinocardiopsis flavida TaxID=645275 RepID=A0A2P8DI48_9ACTN|nr:YbaK/EbsC family protein [Murinocardiopsis flavida]PSK96878.1 prolyl-tRNA editing enzyme YbaK/EbsC (Cys-tRNA(Pro) deacylase) [Murinocardiopsis flavida]
MHPNTQKVAARLAELGVAAEIRELPEAAPTAAIAAAQVGCSVGAIANSLVFAAEYPDADEPRPVLVLTSGAHKVDTGKVAALLGAAKVRRATPDFVREHTGQTIGGVAPLGHPAPVPTLVDEWLRDHTEVWAAGGHAHTLFPTSFGELVRITSGTPAMIGVD